MLLSFENGRREVSLDRFCPASSLVIRSPLQALAFFTEHWCKMGVHIVSEL